MDGLVIKSKKLRATVAKPAADPLLRALKQKKKTEKEKDTRPAEVNLMMS